MDILSADKMKKTRVVNIKDEPYDVYIGRGTKWGNPFKIGEDGNRKEVIAKFLRKILKDKELLSSIEELKGKTLGCHCKPKDCHGDVYVNLLSRQWII